MQAKLPDLNAALAKARMDAIISKDLKNYNKCVASLECMNALLPPEYRISMTDREYSEAIHNDEMWECRHCKKSTPSSDVERTRLPVRASLWALTRARIRTVKAWVCPLCYKLSVTAGTIRNKLENRGLYFLKAVPEPPRRTALIGSHQFQLEFESWYRVTRRELESQIGHYRAEYVSQLAEAGVLEDIPDAAELG